MELGVPSPSFTIRFALPAVMAVLIWAFVGFYFVVFSAAMKALPSMTAGNS